MLRHALGVLGVMAAGVLLAVSAAMNWQFGFSLGRTEFDGQLLGAASAAADCLKALIPFFFFAAIRNKMWSQAIASVLVWTVVTSYSLTSALGFAAQQRADASAQRTQVNQAYDGLRADLKRAEEAASWTPQHRPYEAVQASIQSYKSQPGWKWSNGCKDVSSKTEQKYCQGLSQPRSRACVCQGCDSERHAHSRHQGKTCRHGRLVRDCGRRSASESSCRSCDARHTGHQSRKRADGDGGVRRAPARNRLWALACTSPLASGVSTTATLRPLLALRDARQRKTLLRQQWQLRCLHRLFKSRSRVLVPTTTGQSRRSPKGPQSSPSLKRRKLSKRKRHRQDWLLRKQTWSASTRRASRSRTDRVLLLLNCTRIIVRGAKPRTRSLLRCRASDASSQISA